MNANGDRSAPRAVALDGEDRLPATKLESAPIDGNGHALADQQRPYVAVGVVVDLVVCPAVVGHQLVEPVGQIAEEPRFGFVDDDAHRRVLAEDGTDAARVVGQRGRHAVGDVDEFGSALGVDGDRRHRRCCPADSKTLGETDAVLLAPPAGTPVQSTVTVVADALVAILPQVAQIGVLVAVSVYLANVAVAFGLVERIAGLSRLLTGPANLPDEVGTAILTTTASTTAGYSMLADLRESGYLDDRATLIAVVMNTFFGFAQHVFTYYIPVLIPILGFPVGVLYVGSRALISLAITLVGILAGALLLSERNVDPDAQLDPDELDDEEQTPKARLLAAWERTRPTLKRLIPRLVVVYTLVTLLVTQYDLTAVTGSADPLVGLVGLPSAAVPVIAVYTFDTTSGAAAIAPLLGDVFTPRQAVATLLLGSIVSFAVSTFKRSIPFQYGIWGPEFGTKVIAVNTALKIVFISIAVALLLVV